jgi:hypothetical protein
MARVSFTEFHQIMVTRSKRVTPAWHVSVQFVPSL